MGQIIYFLGDIFPVFLRRFSPFCVVFGRFASFLGPNDGILLPGYRLFSRYDIYIYIPGDGMTLFAIDQGDNTGEIIAVVFRKLLRHI